MWNRQHSRKTKYRRVTVRGSSKWSCKSTFLRRVTLKWKSWLDTKWYMEGTGTKRRNCAVESLQGRSGLEEAQVQAMGTRKELTHIESSTRVSDLLLRLLQFYDGESWCSTSCACKVRQWCKDSGIKHPLGKLINECFTAGILWQNGNNNPIWILMLFLLLFVLSFWVFLHIN